MNNEGQIIQGTICKTLFKDASWFCIKAKANNEVYSFSIGLKTDPDNKDVQISFCYSRRMSPKKEVLIKDFLEDIKKELKNLDMQLLELSAKVGARSEKLNKSKENFLAINNITDTDYDSL